MGCLLLPFELIFDLIFDGWINLMQMIVPERTSNKNFRIILKILVYIFTSVLLFSIVIGLFALILNDENINRIGKYMIFIPVVISIVQIVCGIIARCIRKREKIIVTSYTACRLCISPFIFSGKYCIIMLC